MEYRKLDVLPPSKLIGLVATSVRSYIDNPGAFNARGDEVEQEVKFSPITYFLTSTL